MIVELQMTTKILNTIYLIKNKNTGNYIGNTGTDDNENPCLFTKESHAKLKIKANSKKTI